MQSLSTSVVSLHTLHGSPTDEAKSGKISTKKPSIIYFFALFYSFLSMGFGSGLIGPTLLKFGEQVKSPFEEVVYVLFTRSFGFLIGTLIGGTLIDRFPLLGRTFLTICVFTMCASTLIIPLVYQLVPMIVAHLMWSFTAGIVDNLAQILTIRHYDKFNVNPYLQALHGAFGVGAFLSPLIIAPFLKNTSPVDQWHYAYWLIGCLHIPNIIWILAYALRDEVFSKKIEQITLENKQIDDLNNQIESIVASDEQTNPAEPSSTSKNRFFLILITIFLLLYVGGESAFGAYIHTYATLHLNFPKDISAYINSLFWASFAFGRLCGIPLSIKLSALQMIFIDLIGCICSLTLLYVLNKSPLLLWIGSILYGLSVASIYPSTIAFTERYVSITGKRMSFIAVGGSAGDAIIPLLIGYSINPKILGPIGFILISLAVAILASLLFAFILIYVKHRPEKETVEKK
ncbi:unnamed protein product [Adineta ricciae]|uniref:Major facilitator superfamily (MFS) profile domain-containing protein n=1 Tax=Adineta ricciae TaxID=249248 RepID=A0A814CJE3_ADIRI|nr:unnamed protein product [Adineta ricciae]CAF1067692.1 unnamed protein product [Adineta ricciae]